MNPITTALLSYGMSGEIFHAPLLTALPGFQLTHVLERSQTKSTRRYPQVKVVRSMDDIAKDPSIELVIVNTPNASHHEYAKLLLEAGKHIVVEKPFTVTTAEADDLIALAKKKNRVLTVFQNRRLDGDFLTVKKLIEGNLLGKIVEVETHYDRFRNVIDNSSWKENAGTGVSILYNLGSHMLDQVYMLFGMPQELDARMGIQRPGGAVDDYYDIRMTYSSWNVIVKSSYLVREPGPRYVLHGVNGSFVKYGIDPQEQALKDGGIPGTPGWGTESSDWWGKINTSLNGIHLEGKIETLPGDYLTYYRNVYDAIRENKPLIVKPEESRESMRLIEACFESNRLRKAIKL
jgi:predicted dehydrogenase